MIPEGVNLKIEAGQVLVSGPKGKLSLSIQPGVSLEVKDGQLQVLAKGKTRQGIALHGLTRSLIANMILGVTQGWAKALELHGTGYRVRLEGEKLILELGFSHPVEFIKPEGIEFQVEENKIIVLGPDRQKVGQIAAQIRDLRKPEPYKGKGILFVGEVVRRKVGKAAKVGVEGAPGTGR